MRPQLNPLILGPGAPWSLPGSSIDIQFTTGRAAVNRQKSAISSLLTTTRASTGYAVTSTGSLVLFPTNTPRITDLGLLVEQAATNLALQSQALGTTWVAENSTITANNSAAPDGTTTGNLHTENTSSVTHDIFQSGITLTGSATYTTSVWAKAGTNRYVYLNVQGNSGVWYTAVFDLQGGGTTATQTGAGATSGTVTSTSQTAYINDWYRLTLTGSGTMTSTTIVIGQANAATGNTLSSTNGQISYLGSSRTVSLWGAQLELGSFPTSYIPTTTVAVTRATDFIIYPHNPLGAGNFTMFVSVGGVAVQTGKFPALVAVNDGSGVNQTQIYSNSGGPTANGKEATGGVTRFDTSILSSVSGGAGKIAMTLNGTAARGASNGGNLTALGTWTSSSAFTQMQLGSSDGGTNNLLNGYVKRLAIFQTGMNDAQMQVLTT